MNACGDAIEWYPSELIRPQSQGEEHTARFALIVLNQPLHNHLSVVRQLWDNGARSTLAPPSTDQKEVR